MEGKKPKRSRRRSRGRRRPAGLVARVGRALRLRGLLRTRKGRRRLRQAAGVALLVLLVAGVSLWLADLTRPEPPSAPAAAPSAQRPLRDWKYIVIHHSASESGNADQFDTWHRERGWVNGLGYHFVIDNGRGGEDGNVEIGPRWTDQLTGAHCKTPDHVYNSHGIGICLVGNFNKTMPSPAQLAALDKLVAELAVQCHIRPANIIGHRDAPGTQTECPGDKLHEYVHKQLQGKIARKLAGQ